MVEVDDIKKSMRIDHTIDDNFIQQLIDTATEYIKSAIDSNALDEDMEHYQQFDLAVSLLTQHWYLNRQEASSERMPVTVQALVQQMRGAYYADH
ncbi:head-tail connector protein [Enterococcus faecium]|uniref:head-tail connector protein n=1 Tax=Enterococcus faecium TaxID=1352 RepID=UPI00064CA35A|nr:head-tail connector protein [Enterococcus faecium]MDW8525021.1 head-tail connector protein [Enterococcus lactis]PQF44607.1 phage gp6-like head-tail connector protein [Enterococcus faecium]PWF39708.1 phage gp6-like head-tail connector protein [Enterococcus faecium]WJW78861.1 head-tail connector protein [Enterococcus faecium]